MKFHNFWPHSAASFEKNTVVLLRRIGQSKEPDQQLENSSFFYDETVW